MEDWDYLLGEDASTKTYERGAGHTGGVCGGAEGAGNNMSNFINGRERL